MPLDLTSLSYHHLLTCEEIQRSLGYSCRCRSARWNCLSSCGSQGIIISPCILWPQEFSVDGVKIIKARWFQGDVAHGPCTLCLFSALLPQDMTSKPQIHLVNINLRDKPLYCNITGTLTGVGSSESRTLYFRNCHALTLYHPWTGLYLSYLQISAVSELLTVSLNSKASSGRFLGPMQPISFLKLCNSSIEFLWILFLILFLQIVMVVLYLQEP